jgi:hypothetical protein
LNSPRSQIGDTTCVAAADQIVDVIDTVYASALAGMSRARRPTIETP